MENKGRRRWSMRRVSLILCLFVGSVLLNGCSKNADGVIYLSGVSMMKLTVDSNAKMKDLSALNKAGKSLILNQEWKDKQEIEVLDNLIQGMQAEDAEAIYIDVLSEDKKWMEAEIKRLSDEFMSSSYGSEIPVSVRKVSDLDSAEKSKMFRSDDDLSETKALEDELENENEVGSMGESEEALDEIEDGESTPESSEEATTEENSEPSSETGTSEISETSKVSVPSTAAPTTAASTPTTVPRPEPESTAAPETAVPTQPETAAPETVLETDAIPSESVQEPETAAQERETSAPTSPDVYIPTADTEEEAPYGPGW